jgi:hypothetical protein
MRNSYFPPNSNNGKTLENWHYTNESYTQVSATYIGDDESDAATIIIEVA